MSDTPDTPQTEPADPAADAAPAPSEEAKEPSSPDSDASTTPASASEATTAPAADAATAGEGEAAVPVRDENKEPSKWSAGPFAAAKAAFGKTDADNEPDEMTKVAEENTDLMDRLLRVTAEMENLRKRTEREKADVVKYAVSRFAEDMLRVGDTLQRAIEAAPAEDAQGDAPFKSFLEGIQMTNQELSNALEKHGVTQLDPKGEKFDPNRHQAIAEIEDATAPAGTIAEVYQTGYMIADRVLRPAMVVVSKGPAKTAPAETDEATAPTVAANDDAPLDGSTEAEADAPEPDADTGPSGDETQSG